MGFEIMNITFIAMFISIAFLFKKYYLKEINPMAGYKTKKSMKSRKVWTMANSYSSDLLFRHTIILPVIQIMLYFIYGGLVALLGMLGIWILMLISTIIQTESFLKKSGF
ncbi:MAG: SdpI family protein [Ekhidna sp.]|nr:SdpI family protein [Ekhidna sp.]